MNSKGMLGVKVGMTQLWDENNKVIPVTVIKCDPCHISQIKTNERDGYSAIQLAMGSKKEKNISGGEKGHLKAAGIESARKLVEIRVGDISEYELGQSISVEQFEAGETIDVSAISKGHGFAGGMKRHNFKGQGASHGNHKHHRAPGSIGACATPGRVFKGKRMAGHMGQVKITTQNLKIVGADAERNVLLIKGSVPGSKGAVVFIRSAVKAPLKKVSK
ncbi:MAG: 50S ribosomal protein L3 [Acidimicrobiia bacterium]|nr:50S ribosomal protein L3 [Acidimicrobiia bacterium]